MSVAKVELVASRVAFSCKVFDVTEDRLRDAKGKAFSRCTVKHPGAVVVLPIADDGTLYLVRQYRHPLRGEFLEFPAGTLEVGEAPLETAQREICEEIGYGAHEWKELGVLYPAPGYCDERLYLYVASDLTKKKLEADEDEYIEVVKMGVLEVECAVQDGTLSDA